MGPPSPLEPFPPAVASGASTNMELDTFPAIAIDDENCNNGDNADDADNDADNDAQATDRLRTGESTRVPTPTVAQERRERAESAALTRAGSSAAASSESLPRRLSKSFKESELPRGFLAATADMSSSVVAAARPRSGTARSSRRSSTVSTAAEERSRLQVQPTTSKGAESTMLATLDEHHPRASHSIDGGEREKLGVGVGVGVGVGAAAGAVLGGGVSGSGSGSGTLAPVATDAAKVDADADADADAAKDDGLCGDEFSTGYHFPPRYSRKESLQHGLRAFWAYARTPVGFLVVVYGLNVVAWGAMIFFLLCEAAPAMCHPSCTALESPRRKWIEVDSQILNGLFCVTGFGLAPWRFRDLYFYLQYRVGGSLLGLRRLAGVHRGWLRLPGSDALPPTTGPDNVPPDTPLHAIPFPESKIPDAPLTGQRAPPTRMGRITFVLVNNVLNTVLQAVLAGLMWGMNRYDRPSWSTGVFVAFGCVTGALGGLGIFVEGKRVKGIEGVPLTDEDRERLAHDRALGIYHYNNLQGKKPKAKAAGDLEAGQP